MIFTFILGANLGLQVSTYTRREQLFLEITFDFGKEF